MTAAPSTAAMVAFTFALAGCATPAPDGGVTRVRELARERSVDAPIAELGIDEIAIDRRISALLAQPLTAEAAVEIALSRNPGLRARVAQLAAADAERVQAGRLSNPAFSFSDKRGPEVRSIERALMVNVLNLVTLPMGQKIAARNFEIAQLRLAGDAVALAADTRRAWVRAVAAAEQQSHYERAHEAAAAGAELAARMEKVGNFSRLQRLRERAFAADTAAALARAGNAATAERERLTRLLGLWGEQAQYQLPSRLPEIPGRPDEQTDGERIAMERRLDVLASKRMAEAVADSLALTRVTRFVNVLHAGYVNESERGEARKDGYEIELELPLFDFGDAKAKRAEAIYLAALERTRATAINARSEVRERYAAYRTAYDVARHFRDEVMPLRKAVAEEMLLRYNGMLVGVFDLLADAREQIASVNLAIEAARDFWIADAYFRQALEGGAADGGELAAPAPARASAVGH